MSPDATPTATMIDTLHDSLGRLVEGIGLNLLRVLAYPINPRERVFVLYLATSLAAGALVYWRVIRHASPSSRLPVLLREFLFPRHIWRTASAWLDVRYFFFHQVVRVFLYGSFGAMVSDGTFRAVAGVAGTAAGSRAATASASWPIELGYAFLSVAALDLVAYALHYCQHRYPLLWEFHKVHHSPRVMHPLTNYREHPVDNIVYATGLGVCTGVVAATVSGLLGYVPAEPTVLGVGVFVFAYNSLGYNLRHSHIWLRWPGPLVYVFGSPAHHQVHHSYHPTHVNTNFAFMFPVWDVLFGTFRMPADNADVTFGIGETDEDEFRSCLDLYFVPFRNLLHARRQRGRPAEPNAAVEVSQTTTGDTA